MTRHDIAARVEQFVRSQFAVSPTDGGFTRDGRLFELGYIDSVGVAELLTFIETSFAVTITDDDLLSDRFQTINGIADIVASLRGTPAAVVSSASRS